MQGLSEDIVVLLLLLLLRWLHPVLADVRLVLLLLLLLLLLLPPVVVLLLLLLLLLLAVGPGMQRLNILLVWQLLDILFGRKEKKGKNKFVNFF